MIVTAAAAGRVHRRNGRRGLQRCRRKRTTGRWGLVMVRLSRLQLACLLLPLLFATPCWSQSGSANEWHRKIVEQLRAHLRIPPDLSAKAGDVWVDVTIDRSGFVKSTKLVRGTSVPALDAAVLAAVKEAQPFPLPPRDAQLSPLPPVADDGSLTLPLAFYLSSTKTLNDEQLKARLKGICRGC
jgi:TonB family protein